MIHAMSAHAAADLPDHRALVEHLCARGLQHAPPMARAMEQLR
jgi:hypothetical protein